jgi:hypothetical protein
MLRHGGEALVEQELQAEVIGAHEKAATPQVRAPMPDGLHKADQLPLVGHQFGVASGEWPAEESEGSPIFMEDDAEPCAGRVSQR